MKKRLSIKIIALALALFTTVPFLSSCGSVPAEKAKIGEVNGEAVYYDELYFLVSNYKEGLKKLYGDDEAKIRQELDRLVRENIVANYAILELCEKEGLKYSDVSKEIDDYVDVTIVQDYGGDEELFATALNTYGMTERYFRYTIGIDLLFSQLPEKYLTNGHITGNDQEIINYIKENFIHVYHLALFNDEGDDPAANKAKLEEAASLIESGEKTMDDLIGSKGYTEDFSDPSGNGYYITRGSMMEDYENAAFSLGIGEVSGVVDSYGDNNFGQYVSCYYLIQRAEMNDLHIEANFSTLKNEYVNGIIYEDLQNIRKDMSFTPNNAYEDLDLLDLKAPTDSTGTIVAVIVAAVAVVAVATVVTIIIVKATLKKKNLSSINKPKKKGGKG